MGSASGNMDGRSRSHRQTPQERRTVNAILATDHAKPIFRVYDGDADDDAMSAETMFSEYYEVFRTKVLLSRVKRNKIREETIEEYDAAAHAFLEVIGDMPMRLIDVDVLDAFISKSRECRGKKPGSLRSPQTILKHIRHLQPILDHAGPRYSCRQAVTEEGLFGVTQNGWPKPAPAFPDCDFEEPEVRGCYTLEEVEAWLAHCDIARAPRVQGVRPEVWWGTLIRAVWNSDMRRQTFMAFRREWIHETGHGDAVAEIPREFYKHGRAKKEKPLVYLSIDALDAIKSIPTLGVVWPWPASYSHLDTIRREIQTAAGISAEHQEYAFHGLRRSGLTALYLEDPDAARAQAGHRSLKTTVGSYVQTQARVDALAAKMRDPHARLAQPGRTDGQRRLF
jgi:hypothetical protein